MEGVYSGKQYMGKGKRLMECKRVGGKFRRKIRNRSKITRRSRKKKGKKESRKG